LRWTVAIFALLGLFAQQDSTPRIHKQGEIDLYDAGAADRYKDRESITVCVDCQEPVVQATESFKGSDLWFQAGRRRFLHPQHGAVFAKVSPGGTGYDYCANATYKRGAIRIDKLPADAQICIRTDERRYCAIQIIRYIPESGRLSISYTTWEK
jgi:hypothetical protein